MVDDRLSQAEAENLMMLLHRDRDYVNKAGGVSAVVFGPTLLNGKTSSSR